MPHADRSSQRTHERIGAMLFLAAVPLCIPSLLDRPQRAPVLLYAAVAVAAGAGLLLLRGGQLGHLIRECIPETGVVLLSIGIAAGGSIASQYAIFYVWIALASGLFQAPRRVAMTLAATIVGSAAAVAIASSHTTSTLVNWLLIVGTCVGAAIAAAWLVSRYESAQQVAVAARADAERMSLTDPLTGLANRRSAERDLQRTLASAHRSSRPVAALLVDIDRFKDINDEHGHAAGDEALAEIASRLQGATRDADLVSRWGGDEFLVVLDGPCDVEAVAVAAERIRHAVGSTPLATGQTTTVSVGGAIATEPAPELADELTDAADRALYDAKREGRDRIAITTTTTARLRVAG